MYVLAAPVGVWHADGQDGGDRRHQGGAQQVLPLRPLPLRPGGGIARDSTLTSHHPYTLQEEFGSLRITPVDKKNIALLIAVIYFWG